MGHVIWCYLLLLCLTGSVLARSPDRDENIVSLKPFVQFLKHDMQYGGCTVMLGVPTGWRTLDRDSLNDAKLHDVILQADIVSPWTVGRYASPESAARHGDELWRQDIEWCDRHAKQYMPVVFPGFSWHNMKPDSSLDRRRSRFSRCRRFGHQKVILVKPPEIGYHGGYGTAVHGS